MYICINHLKTQSNNEKHGRYLYRYIYISFKYDLRKKEWIKCHIIVWLSTQNIKKLYKDLKVVNCQLLNENIEVTILILTMSHENIPLQIQ